MTRIEQIQQALARARAAGDNEAAAEIESLLAREQGQEALRVNAANPSSVNLTQEQIDERQREAVRQAEEAQRAAPLPQGPAPVGAVEGVGRGILGGLVSTGAFLQGAIVDPVANAVEFAEAGLTGREPQYRSRYAEGLQAAQNITTPEGREVGVAGQIGLGAGQAVAMIPEMFVGGAGPRALRAGEQILDAGAQTWRQFAQKQLEESARASAMIAPRMSSQTAVEAEQAGATPAEALAAGLVELPATVVTNTLPIAAAGRLGTRLATGAVGGVAAEAGVQGAVNPLLPEELAAQRDLTDPTNLTTAAGLGALMGAAFGTRPAPKLSDAARDLAAMRDAEVARGIEAAQQQDSVRQAEEAIAELNKLTEKALNRKKGDTNPLFGESAYPRVEEPAPIQEAITFPEQAPLQRDIFGNEVEARVMTPPSEVEAQASNLEAKARAVREATTAIDDRINTLVEQKARIVPTGPRGGYTRADRVSVDRLDRQILNLQARKRELETGAVNIEAAATSARLDLPSESTRPEEDIRRDYLLTMQGRQYDQAERARLGEMEAQGAGSTPDLFQPTKPRVRAELEPEQGTLPLPKPRIRVGESLEQQGPVLPQPEAPRPAPAPLEGPTMELPLNQPQRQSAPKDLSAEAEGPARETQRLSDARKVYVQDLNTAKSELTKARNEVTKFNKADQPVPQDVLDRAEAASLRVREAEFTLGRFDRLSKRDQAKGGTTPAPLPQTASTAPLTRAERIAQAAVPATTTTDVLDPATGRTVEQVAETAIAPNDPERVAIEQRILRDAQQAAATNRSINPRLMEAASRVLNRTVAPEQRQSTPLRQALSRATTAWDALAGVRAAVSRGADPKIERYDRLIQVLSTPDMKDVEFSVLQPETEARTEAQRRVKEGRGLDAFTKGIHEIDRATGKQSVTITGDGYASRDGTATVETTLHEIVHAKTAKAVADVKAGRETNERVVKAVKDFEAVRGEVRKADRKDLSREEAEAIDYATSDVDEFLSGTMTNPLVQSALKKEGFWKRVVNTIRIMLGVPRSQKNVLDEVLDAAYAVVDAVNAKESKSVGDVEGGIQRSVAQPTSNRERILGKGTKTRPMRTTQSGMFVDRVSRGVDSWLSAHKGGTKETTEAQSKAQGVVQRTLAELQVAVARMDRQLHSIRIGPRAELARQYLNAKPDDKPAIAQKIEDKKLVAALDRSRSIIDNLSNRLRAELASSYTGKDMPQSTLNLLKTIERNIGTYTTRAYLIDLEEGSARALWGDYKRGDAQAKERLQPLVDMVTGKLEGLSDWIEGARQEAELLSSTRLQFDPEETQFGRELRQRYGDFIGNPGTKTKAEMFRDLEKFASDLKREDFDKQRDNAVQKMLGVFEDNGTADALSTYYRGMRGDDRTLRQRENVPPELRKAWGEILDPILTVQLTANRAAAALAGIRSSNYMVDEFPNLFSSSVDGDTNRIKQIPNNGVAYGKAAGMYTTPEVFEFMTASAATLSLFDTSKDAAGKILGAAKWTIGAARTVTSYAKLNMIAFNITTQTVLSTLNFVAMPLTNGHFNLKRLPEAIKLSKRLVGTSYRTSDISPELLEIIEQGVVDPVQLRVDEEARSQEKENRLLASSRQGGNAAQQWFGVLRGRKNQVVSYVIEPLRETVSFFEVAPKVFNFLAAKDELKAAYPEMSSAEVVRLAAEQTNRLNPTYARTRNIVGATETLGVSYTANYMEQIASTTARSLKMGYDQAKLGIQTGDTPLALMGLRKLMGVASVAGLSYALPGMIQAAFGLGESEEDELIKDNLPFVERGMQPVIIDSDGEFIRYFDAGRLNPYDTVHAPMRAILSAVANLTSGNTEEASRDLEGATKNLAGQFAGGSPLGQTIVSLATNTPRTNTLENDLPGLYSWLVTVAGGDKQAAGLASSAYMMGTPSIGRSFISTLSRYLKEEPGEGREAFLEDKVNSLTAIGIPVRTVNANQNMTFQASSMARARTEASNNLGNILLVPGNLSHEDIEAAVDDYLTSQLEPFAQAKQVVEARRALGRRQGESQRVTDAAIRETLKAERVDGNTIESLLSDNPFTPKPLSESFSELRAQRRAQRDNQRSERAHLEALYNERIEKAQRMVNERVRSWSSENN